MPFARISHLDMHYETGGDGKNVFLLLHGNFASWRWWLPILRNTPRGCRYYAPDMRGCGDSDHPEEGYTIDQHADDMDDLIQALRLPRLHLVGHSLGGGVALAYAINHPKKIRSLTLVAPAPAQGRALLEAKLHNSSFINNPDTMYSAFRLSENLGTTRNIFRRALSKMISEEFIDGNFETLVDDAVRMSRAAAVGHLQALNTWDVQDAISELMLPVLIIGGRDDVLIPPEALAKTADIFPNSRLIIWPRMGHTPQLEQPERFSRMLHKFTQQHSAVTLTKIRAGICRLFLNMSKATDNDCYPMCG